MEKTLRCTVCTWRGPWSEAELASPVHPSDIPPPMQDIQEAYEERQSERASFGTPREPSCPSCGHHTVLVRKVYSSRPGMPA